MTPTDPAALAALLRETADTLDAIRGLMHLGELAEPLPAKLRAAAAALERPEGRTPDVLTPEEIADLRGICDFGSHLGIGGKVLAQLLDSHEALRRATPRSGDTPTEPTI